LGQPTLRQIDVQPALAEPRRFFAGQQVLLLGNLRHMQFARGGQYREDGTSRRDRLIDQHQRLAFDDLYRILKADQQLLAAILAFRGQLEHGVAKRTNLARRQRMNLLRHVLRVQKRGQKNNPSQLDGPVRKGGRDFDAVSVGKRPRCRTSPGKQLHLLQHLPRANLAGDQPAVFAHHPADAPVLVDARPHDSQQVACGNLHLAGHPARCRPK
jgi:hypothetical protein